MAKVSFHSGRGRGPRPFFARAGSRGSRGGGPVVAARASAAAAAGASASDALRVRKAASALSRLDRRLSLRFESESLRYPGFVEFDDVNSKVLTYSAADKMYKVWDLKNYTHLYSITDNNIYEIKISPG